MKYCGFSLLLVIVLMEVGCGGPPEPRFEGGTFLTGEIVDGEGRTIERALVQIEKKGELISEVFSDQNGRFSLEGLPSGEFDLLITKGEQFLPFRFSEDWEKKKLLNVADLEIFSGGRGFLQLKLIARQTVLTGLVLSAETEEAIGGVTITTYPTTRTVYSNKQGAYTLESDRFEEGIPYQVIFNHGKFQPEQINLEKIRIAQVNEMGSIKLNPGLLDKEVGQGEVDYGSEESQGKVTQGEQ
jgi:hypothetical protein